MVVFSVLLALLSRVAAEPQPYSLGATATADGAKLTITRLLDATNAGDDTAYDRIARGMMVMLAPDFGVPVTRARFAELLQDCTGPHVVSAAPFPKMPPAQAVRVSMQCRDEDHPQPREMIADIMADNEHAFVFLPGGVSKVWPASKP
jgi:hypothetical protein